MSVRIILLLAAVVGLAGAQGRSSPVSPARPSPAEVPTVGFCDLMSRPADYHGKEIRVRAEYNLGFEWSYFADFSCKDYAVETTPRRTANVVWAEFDESADSSVRPELRQKLRKALAVCCPSGWHTAKTEMVVSGKFFQAAEGEYGHLGLYVFQLVVSRVEGVGETEYVKP